MKPANIAIVMIILAALAGGIWVGSTSQKTKAALELAAAERMAAQALERARARHTALLELEDRYNKQIVTSNKEIADLTAEIDQLQARPPVAYVDVEALRRLDASWQEKYNQLALNYNALKADHVALTIEAQRLQELADAERARYLAAEARGEEWRLAYLDTYDQLQRQGVIMARLSLKLSQAQRRQNIVLAGVGAVAAFLLVKVVAK